MAEMSAAVLCQLQRVTGFEHNAYQYIARYAETKDPTAVLAFLMGALADVEKVVTRILEIADEDSAEQPVPAEQSISA